MRFVFVILISLFAFFTLTRYFEEPVFSFRPVYPQQGDPLMITLEGTFPEKVKSMSIGSTTLAWFSYRGKPAALVGFDLMQATGTYSVYAELSDGRVLTDTLVLQERKKIKIPLGIPQKLGGNTPKSQQRLVVSLVEENNILAHLDSVSEALWSEPFIMPLASTTITDTYGYIRLTGAYAIPHKGVDFRAATGTPVVAMNRGVVTLVREFRTYGKTIVLDHGLGLQTLYMHLAETLVAEGEAVAQGQLIALSGETGYAERPHLHLSVRINKVSIDPSVFLDLFGIRPSGGAIDE